MSMWRELSEAVRVRYSYSRFQWLAIAIAGMSIMTFSAQELWGGNVQGLPYIINLDLFYFFAIMFVAVIFLTNATDYKKLSKRMTIVITCASLSVIFDIGILFFSEWLVLLTINQLPTDLISALVSVFLLVLPWCLGEISLSSVTMEYMKKRAEKLLREATELRKENELLQKQLQEREKAQKEFEKNLREFKKAFEKSKDSGEDK